MSDQTGGAFAPEDENVPDYHRVYEVAAILARRWSIDIMITLAAGELHFLELQRQLRGVAHKVLADHLRTLESHVLVERSILKSQRRVCYRLTARGQSLLPIIAAMRAWMTRPCGGSADQSGSNPFP